MATGTTSAPHIHGGLKTGITALAGGAAPTLAAQTLEAYNVIATCATSGDSVILPAGMPFGTEVMVLNSGAAPAHVFPPTGGTVNGGTVTTGDFAVTNAKSAIFKCVDATGAGLTWLANLSA